VGCGWGVSKAGKLTLSCDEKRYQRMACNLRRGPRTAIDKKRYELRCKQMIKQFGKLHSDGSFLDNELDLLSRCNDTFGLAEVDYIVPQVNEIGEVDTAETTQRRLEMGRKLKEFELVQTRHAMSMMSGGAGRPTLLVALDHLLKKYDDELQWNCLEPSNLREHLRLANYERENELRMIERWNCKRRRKVNEELNVARIEDLDIPTEEHNRLCRHMRSEICAEESILILDEEAKNSDLR